MRDERFVSFSKMGTDLAHLVLMESGFVQAVQEVQPTRRQSDLWGQN
jgi:hypothetical protein